VRRVLGIGLAATLAVVSLATISNASAADFTWTGGAPSSSPQWSDAANWASGTAPSGSVGTLAFPALANCGQTTCNVGIDDISGLQAQGLSLELGGGYTITGSPLQLGAGGLSATLGATPAGFDDIGLPVTLNAPQTWSVAQPPSTTSGASRLSFTGGVTGPSDSLALQLQDQASLALGPDTEVGAITASGQGSVLIASTQHASVPGSGPPGMLNATDGNPIALSGGATLSSIDPTPPTSAAFFTPPDLATETGPLTSTGGRIAPGGTMSVDGDVSLDDASTTTLQIFDGPGSNQIDASGAIQLGGTLALAAWAPDVGPATFEVGPFSTPGETLQLIDATGTLSGTFANAPEGALLPLASHPAQIAYTPHTVTATIVPGFTLSVQAQGAVADPSMATQAVTNQPVTISAAGGPTYPAGTVTFFDDPPGGADRREIPGCADLPLTPTNGSTVQCTTSFTPGDWDVAARFDQGAHGTEPIWAHGVPPVTAGAEALNVAVQPASSSLGITSTSNLKPTRASSKAGVHVGFTVGVSPQFHGEPHPTGTPALTDDGTPGGSCGPIEERQPSFFLQASCAITYRRAGVHVIAVHYAGDSNFTGSTSNAIAVTVPSTRTGPASRIKQHQATLHGTVSDEHTPVTWQAQYWRQPGEKRLSRVRHLGARTHPAKVALRLVGLRAGSRYHYRLIATTVPRTGTQPVTWTGRTLSLRTSSR
jgi:hypothetical protein